LNNHIVNSVYIELHFCSAVTVSQTKLGFLQVTRLYKGIREEKNKIVRNILMKANNRKAFKKEKHESEEMQTFKSLMNLSKCNLTPRRSS